MKARKYTKEQIISVLKEGEAGAKVADLCRKYGMRDASYYGSWPTRENVSSVPGFISCCDEKSL
jgi:hypothetical protein